MGGRRPAAAEGWCHLLFVLEFERLITPTYSPTYLPAYLLVYAPLLSFALVACLSRSFDFSLDSGTTWTTLRQSLTRRGYSTSEKMSQPQYGAPPPKYANPRIPSTHYRVDNSTGDADWCSLATAPQHRTVLKHHMGSMPPLQPAQHKGMWTVSGILCLLLQQIDSGFRYYGAPPPQDPYAQGPPPQGYGQPQYGQYPPPGQQQVRRVQT